MQWVKLLFPMYCSGNGDRIGHVFPCYPGTIWMDPSPPGGLQEERLNIIPLHPTYHATPVVSGTMTIKERAESKPVTLLPLAVTSFIFMNVIQLTKKSTCALIRAA